VTSGRTSATGRALPEGFWAEKVRADRLRAIGRGAVHWTTADLRRPLERARRPAVAFGG